VIVVSAASVQDRDAARHLLWWLAAAFRHISLIWGDGGYAGKLVTWAAGTLHRTLQIVKRPDDLHTFKVLPRRWVIERTFGWIMKCRRCVRDDEHLPDHHKTYLLVHDHHHWTAGRPPPQTRCQPTRRPCPIPRHMRFSTGWSENGTDA
jgi:transposase